MITIKEMAEIAGVSPTTVANVLHKRNKKVSKETIEKVQKVIEQSNYVSNMGARMLGNYGSKIIAVVISYANLGSTNPMQDPFASNMIGIMEQKISSQGYFMMLYTNPNVEECLHMAQAWNVEGLILLGVNRQQYYMFRARLDIPIVTIDTNFERNDTEYVNIGLKDYEGGYEMTEYLISKGHKKIAFLEHAPGNGVIDSIRYKGYQDALKKYGLSKYIKRYTLDYNPVKREEKLLTLCKDHFDSYTAFFFSADYLAINAMNVFMDYGYHIPNDISIAGFDDILSSLQCRPKLTTVKQDMHAKGENSVEKLIEMIKKKNNNIKNHTLDIKLPIQLMIRGSVRQLNENIDLK